MSRPKTGSKDPPGEEEGEPKPLMPAFEGDIRDSVTQAVWEKAGTAKSWFKILDANKNSKVDQQEFTSRMSEILADHNPSEESLLALWKQTDLDEDGFITWDEFKNRFLVNGEEFETRNQPPALETPALDILLAIREPIFAYYSKKKKT